MNGNIGNGIIFFIELNRKIYASHVWLDTTKTYKFEIIVGEDDQIRFIYFENGTEFHQLILKTKLRADGYLYLKNHNIKFWGIPYIFGGLDLKRIRISKTDGDDLVLDIAHNKSGNIIFLAYGRTARQRQVYKRR